MRRSDFVMKLLSVVVFLAIALYLGIYLYQSARNPFQTTVAVAASIQQSGKAEGMIVRDETVIPGDQSKTVVTAGDGARVRAGSVIAVSYGGASALQTAGDIRALKMQIAAAEAALDQSGDRNIRNMDTVLELSGALRHRRFDDVQALALSVRGSIYKTGGQETQPLEELRAQLALLESKNVDVREIVTDEGGVFSASVDGYEHIGPSALTQLTPNGLRRLVQEKSEANASLGKLIRGTRWYFAATMKAADAEKLGRSGSVTVNFQKSYKKSIQMDIESISVPENGLCAVVFSCDYSLAETSVLRNLSAEVIFGDVSGLSVPREAIRLDDDGNTCIYLLTGYRAEEVAVDILAEFGDSYIVADGSVSGTVLRAGAEVIVRANDLYDGKVVK